MDDIKLAMFGNKEAAKRLTEHGDSFSNGLSGQSLWLAVDGRSITKVQQLKIARFERRPSHEHDAGRSK